MEKLAVKTAATVIITVIGTFIGFGMVRNVSETVGSNAQVRALDKAPIKIDQSRNYDSKTITLSLLSTVGSVEIQSITLNRGNCKLMSDLHTYRHYDVKSYQNDGTLIDQTVKSLEDLEPGDWETFTSSGWQRTTNVPFVFGQDFRKLGITLKYGNTTRLATSCTAILSVEIKTNLGTWSYSMRD